MHCGLLPYSCERVCLRVPFPVCLFLSLLLSLSISACLSVSLPVSLFHGLCLSISLSLALSVCGQRFHHRKTSSVSVSCCVSRPQRFHLLSFACVESSVLAGMPPPSLTPNSPSCLGSLLTSISPCFPSICSSPGPQPLAYTSISPCLLWDRSLQPGFCGYLFSGHLPAA